MKTLCIALSIVFLLLPQTSIAGPADTTPETAIQEVSNLLMQEFKKGGFPGSTELCSRSPIEQSGYHLDCVTFELPMDNETYGLHVYIAAFKNKGAAEDAKQHITLLSMTQVFLKLCEEVSGDANACAKEVETKSKNLPTPLASSTIMLGARPARPIR